MSNWYAPIGQLFSFKGEVLSVIKWQIVHLSKKGGTGLLALARVLVCTLSQQLD